MLKLTIAGADCTALLQAGSLTIVDDLTGRGTCSFVLVDYSADPYDPVEGSHVLITDGYGDKRFAGQIDRTAREIMPGRDRALKLDISCLSYSALLDRYVVTGVWYASTCKQILQDVFAADSTYCEIGGRTTPWPVAGEGIIVGEYVQDGPMLEKVVGNYQSVGDLLNELAKIATFKWFVDYDKQLHFFARETAVAPFEVRDHTRNARKISVTRELEQDRNQPQQPTAIPQQTAAARKAIAELIADMVADAEKALLEVAEETATLRNQQQELIAETAALRNELRNQPQQTAAAIDDADRRHEEAIERLCSQQEQQMQELRAWLEARLPPTEAKRAGLVARMKAMLGRDRHG